MKCPSCYTVLETDAPACDCGWRRPVKTPEQSRKEQNESSLARARANAAAHVPQQTEQGWYNVCKYFPAIARRVSQRSGKPMADVGPHNPLDATARSGPINVANLPLMREPGEDG